LLKENDVPFEYREYRENPLSVDEIRDILDRLGLGARALLRRGDAVAKQLELTGDEPEERLIELMSENPTLLQRPIGRYEGRVEVGRPPSRLLDLVR
jgi:arsenate reductase